MSVTKKLLTLCFIVQPPKILLAMKKRGFGAGRWNGLGGKVAPGESILDAARRELHEEIGVVGGAMTQRGVIEFQWQGKPDILQVHIYQVESFAGDPVESDEMKPQWFDIADIPYDEMWQDDRYWLPLFLAGKNFSGSFLFDENDRIVDYTLTETSKAA